MPSQNPLEGWTPGSAIAGYRELVYDDYIFPLSMQEVSRTSKLAVDKRKIARVIGEYSANPKSTMQGRDIQFVGDVGTGLMGSAGNTLVTATDLENERVLLARKQNLGKKKLWTRWDRYILAELEEFDFKYLQDGGAFRFASFDAKFYAADPRYYSATVNTASGGPYTNTAENTLVVSHLGNTRAYPIITITGACTHPRIRINLVSLGLVVSVTFSTLTMVAGDTLVIACDPRPETRNSVATYTLTSTGIAANALPYCNPATDFANNYDATEFFPFIEDPTLCASQTLGVTSSAAGSYTVSVAWNDTWL